MYIRSTDLHDSVPVDAGNVVAFQELNVLAEDVGEGYGIPASYGTLRVESSQHGVGVEGKA